MTAVSWACVCAMEQQQDVSLEVVSTRNMPITTRRNTVISHATRDDVNTIKWRQQHLDRENVRAFPCCETIKMNKTKEWI